MCSSLELFLQNYGYSLLYILSVVCSISVNWTELCSCQLGYYLFCAFWTLEKKTYQYILSKELYPASLCDWRLWMVPAITQLTQRKLLKCSIRKFKWREEGYYFCRNFKNILSTKSRSSEYYSVCYFHAISQPLSLFKDNLIICHMYIFSLFTIKAVDITTSGNGSCLYSWG